MDYSTAVRLFDHLFALKLGERCQFYLHRNEPSANGYCYHWWTARYSISNKDIRIYFARGRSGQYIFGIPEGNAVVVFTWGNYLSRNQSQPVNLLVKVIILSMME